MLNIDAAKENLDLRRHILGIDSKILEMREKNRELEKLRQFINIPFHQGSKTIIARVVAVDSSTNFRVIRVDRGSQDGITLESPVVNGKGLVGFVFRMTKHYADIMTVMDTNCRVDALITATRSHGIVEGRGGNRIIMKYISMYDPVKLGDEVVTAGLGNIFPKGVPIGTVTHIERENYGITQYLELDTAVDFNNLEEVLVFTTPFHGTHQNEWDQLNKASELGKNREGVKRW